MFGLVRILFGFGLAVLLVATPLPGRGSDALAKECDGNGMIFKNGRCRCKIGLVKVQGECVRPDDDDEESCPNGYIFKRGKCRLDEVPEELPDPNVKRDCHPGRHWEPGPDGGCVRD